MNRRVYNPFEFFKLRNDSVIYESLGHLIAVLFCHHVIQ
jgi:hypothetical protein